MTKRVQELKAELAKRGQIPGSAGARPRPLSSAAITGTPSSGSMGPMTTSASVLYHTPEPSETSGKQMSYLVIGPDPTSSAHVASDQSYLPPPHPATRTSSPSPPRHGRRALVPSPPTSYDDEIAMAEAHDESVRMARRPSPPVNMPDTPPPPTRNRQSAASRARAAAIAEMEDLENIPPEALFSSPPPAPLRTIRTEASTARSARAGPGPSTQQASVARAEAILQGSKPVQLAVNHPWSKEVNKKLREVFKLPGFRKHQKEAVDETMAGRDGKLEDFNIHMVKADPPVFVLMPTGGGKSLTCQSRWRF